MQLFNYEENCISQECILENEFVTQKENKEDGAISHLVYCIEKVANIVDFINSQVSIDYKTKNNEMRHIYSLLEKGKLNSQ